MMRATQYRPRLRYVSDGRAAETVKSELIANDESNGETFSVLFFVIGFVSGSLLARMLFHAAWTKNSIIGFERSRPVYVKCMAAVTSRVWSDCHGKTPYKPRLLTAAWRGINSIDGQAYVPCPGALVM
ncbi:hypothetical protein E2C01_043328 [Portunus trituberculatus]|uniref:Uncharacterized protein n=1 Tax=Portunus trituberculatus TaxID=210409 RepID=A0A5B7FW10_PORTR|nr:hypothetical protein [Portunus trituberculatus]